MTAPRTGSGGLVRIADLHALQVLDRDDLPVPADIRRGVDLVETGGPDLAQRLETEGYEAWR